MPIKVDHSLALKLISGICLLCSTFEGFLPCWLNYALMSKILSDAFFWDQHYQLWSLQTRIFRHKSKGVVLDVTESTIANSLRILSLYILDQFKDVFWLVPKLIVHFYAKPGGWINLDNIGDQPSHPFIEVIREFSSNIQTQDPHTSCQPSGMMVRPYFPACPFLIYMS